MLLYKRTKAINKCLKIVCFAHKNNKFVKNAQSAQDVYGNIAYHHVAQKQ